MEFLGEFFGNSDCLCVKDNFSVPNTVARAVVFSDIQDILDEKIEKMRQEKTFTLIFGLEFFQARLHENFLGFLLSQVAEVVSSYFILFHGVFFDR